MDTLASTHTAIPAERTLLKKEVFSILDSKIQYQKFIVNDAMKEFEVDADSRIDETEPSIAPAFNDQVFELIESSNKNLHLLLFLRERLEDWNTPQIFDLITNSKYLDYSEEELTYLLEPKHVVDIVYRARQSLAR